MGRRANIFAYRKSFDFENINLQNRAVSETGTGLDITLIPRQTISSNIHANVDFISEYEGFVDFEVTEPCYTVIELRFYHQFGSQPGFWASRNYEFRLPRDSEETVPLNVFNSRSQVPLGRFTTRDGVEIEITEADLKSELTLELVLRVWCERRGSRERIANTLNIVSDLGQAYYYQYQPFVNVPETPSVPELTGPPPRGLRRRRGRMLRRREEIVSFIRYNPVAVGEVSPATVIGAYKASVHHSLQSGEPHRRGAEALGIHAYDEAYILIFNFVLPDDITADLLLLRHRNLKDGETATSFSQNTAVWRIVAIERGVQNTRVICNVGN